MFRLKMAPVADAEKQLIFLENETHPARHPGLAASVPNVGAEPRPDTRNCLRPCPLTHPKRSAK